MIKRAFLWLTLAEVRMVWRYVRRLLGEERNLKLNCGESVGLQGLFQGCTFLKTQLVPDWMGWGSATVCLWSG